MMSTRAAGHTDAQATVQDASPVWARAVGSILDNVFSRILQQYRQRYVLTFSPGEDTRPGWHRLEVALRNRPGRVVARAGYVAQ